MLEDQIADALKEFNGIREENIEDAIKRLALRGITVDRSADNFRLAFFDRRSGRETRYRSTAFRRSPNKIPNFEEFHKLATLYLGQFTIVCRDEKQQEKRTNGVFLGLSDIVRMSAAAVYDDLMNIPTCMFEVPQSDDTSIEEFVCARVSDRRSKIVLRGRSAWTLGELKRRLEDKGYNSVYIRNRPIEPLPVQRTTHAVRQLSREVFTVSKFANFIWGIVGLVAGFLFRQITL